MPLTKMQGVAEPVAGKSSIWTTDSLYTHMLEMMNEKDKLTSERFSAVEEKFVAAEKAVNAALQAQQQAVLKAEHAANERFQSVNEFRSTLSDQTATFIPRPEAIQRIDGVDGKVHELTSRLDRLEARSAGLNSAWVMISTVASIIISAIAAVVVVMK